MVYSIIISVLLAILVLFLVAKLNQRNKEKEQLDKQEKRQWMLKVALEQSCQVPTVEAEELAPIEAEISRLMDSAKTDKSSEEKIRSLIMGLYEAKVNARKSEAKPQKPGSKTGK
jgi:Na+-transporting NADH:ubiquinone oxidoreductase subunit NqrC